MKSTRFAITVAVLTVLSTAARADLHDPNNSADYLIVTTQGLISSYPWIQDLATWRTAHGRAAMVVPVENVWTEFGTGAPSDTVLKEFLHFARRNWQPPQLRDVFIIGSHDVVPWHVEPDSMYHEDSARWERSDFLSDLFYATDPDSSNFIPVLSIGRLPWSPAGGAPLWDYYEKITAYENATGDWQARVHLVADSSLDSIFAFAEWVESMLAPQVHPGYTIERDYLASPPGDPFHGDCDEVLANLNAGSYLMAYWGHYDSTQWSPDSMRIDSADLAALSNGDRLPIVVGMGNTHDGSLMSFLPIPLALVANPQGGAIGYIGCTTIGWVTAGTLFRAHLIALATSDSVATLGDIWRMTEAEFVSSCPPGSLTWPGSSLRQTALGGTLFGDPGLRLPPRPSSVPPASPAVAERFRIAGCYPNPFNATTRVEFDLPHQTHVALRVYDVTGRLAATLVDEVRAAGRHTVLWDGTGLGSGVYFAVLESPSSRAVHKVVLLK